MQRAGFLIAVCLAAEDRQPAAVDRVAAKTASLLQRTSRVPSSVRGDVESYLGSLRLWNRYAPLRGRALTEEDAVQVQDLWLADPRLRSATGALTPENATEMPQLAASLRLLREANYTRTDRGRALLAAASPERVAAMRAAQLTPNPLLLPAGAQLLILAALIEADGDFLQSVWRTSPAIDADVFTRAEFASALAAACADLRARVRGRARSGADQALLARLARWEQAVGQERKSGSEWGGGRPPDQMATVRLEPMIDLGMIDKVDRYAYRYQLNDAQRTFWGRLAEASDSREFVRAGLVAGWMAANGRSEQRAEKAAIWDAIRRAYASLRSSLGFASFAEVILLAVGELLDASPALWFELQDGINVLAERRRDSPKDVRLGINRAGELTYMKLSDVARTP
jgi:hypothetical protein